MLAFKTKWYWYSSFFLFPTKLGRVAGPVLPYESRNIKDVYSKLTSQIRSLDFWTRYIFFAIQSLIANRPKFESLARLYTLKLTKIIRHEQWTNGRSTEWFIHNKTLRSCGATIAIAAHWPNWDRYNQLGISFKWQYYCSCSI